MQVFIPVVLNFYPVVLLKEDCNMGFVKNNTLLPSRSNDTSVKAHALELTHEHRGKCIRDCRRNLCTIQLCDY